MLKINQNIISEEEWKNMVTLAKRVAINNRITNKYIAEQVGVSESTISRIFDLKFSPQLKLFIDICNCLNITISIDN